jgi:excisionase family DNA binding protein
VEKLAYSVREVAEILGVGRNTAYYLVNGPDFPSIRLGDKRIVVPVDALDAWLEARATRPKKA